VKTGCHSQVRRKFLNLVITFHEPSNLTLSCSKVMSRGKSPSPVNDHNSLRIFRQGYEFLEPLDQAPGFRTGLNFAVSKIPERLFRMLTQSTWLGTNFGSYENDKISRYGLVPISTCSFFLVPPVVEESYFQAQVYFI